MFTLQFSTLLAMSCSSDRQISMVYLKIFLSLDNFGTKIYLLSFENLNACLYEFPCLRCETIIMTIRMPNFMIKWLLMPKWLFMAKIHD